MNRDLNHADAPVHHLQVPVKALIPATTTLETICIPPEKSLGAHLQAPMTDAYVAIAGAKVAADEMISTMEMLFTRRQKARTVEAVLGGRSRRGLQTSLWVELTEEDTLMCPTDRDWWLLMNYVYDAMM
jgi:hypothetical protein